MSSPSPTQIAAKLRAALTGNLAGLNASIAYGTIAALPPTSNPNTVNVYLNNNATGAQPSTANNVSYLSDYSPAVGDAVLLLAGQAASQTSYVVIGTLSGATGGGSSGVPVGFMGMFPTTISYPNWLLCDGSTFSAATYPALNSLLGGNTLPDMRDMLPMGAHTLVTLGNTAGSATSTGLVAHTHTGPSHTHTSAAHAHNHNHNDSGHTHNHGHTGQGGGAGGFVGWTGAGSFSLAAGSGQPKVSSTDSDNTSGSANIANNSTSTTPGPTGSGGTGATGSAGSGSTFPILPPVLGVAYYIKAA